MTFEQVEKGTDLYRQIVDCREIIKSLKEESTKLLAPSISVNFFMPEGIKLAVRECEAQASDILRDKIIEILTDYVKELEKQLSKL